MMIEFRLPGSLKEPSKNHPLRKLAFPGKLSSTLSQTYSYDTNNKTTATNRSNKEPTCQQIAKSTCNNFKLNRLNIIKQQQYQLCWSYTRSYLLVFSFLFALSLLSGSSLQLDNEELDGQSIQVSSPASYGSDPADNQLTKIPAITSNALTPQQQRQQLNASRVAHRAKLANQKRSQAAAYLQLAQTELLPFAEFNVQQPAFSDLMRSWPPTTQQAANSLLQFQQQQQQLQQARQQQLLHRQQLNSRLPSSASSRIGGQHQAAASSSMTSHIQPEDLARNHLNEDLDDTLVTADQDFEHDQLPEPATWINYLGEAGDQIYLQLKQIQEQQLQHQRQQQPSLDEEDSSTSGGGGRAGLKLDALEEMLDDHYYGQYENSQVLYYGPQLVREGDLLEIGCYLPLDQPAEWTRSGRPITSLPEAHSRVKTSDFLGAKLNFSLKIFEASLSDSGNYRCNKMSRKYHKLVVVPANTNNLQLYLIQQRLLSVVKPSLLSLNEPNILGSGPASSLYRAPKYKQLPASSVTTTNNRTLAASSKRPDYLQPSQLIIENEPLLVNCNISDESVLRRLREHQNFQLAWYKNGKLITRSSSRFTSSNAQLAAPSNSNVRARQLPVGVSAAGKASSGSGIGAGGAGGTSAIMTGQRIQFIGMNGRQLYINSALYTDAGEYLCSWSRLPASRVNPHQSSRESNENSDIGDGSPDSTTMSNMEEPPAQQQTNPLAAGSFVHLVSPVKLRPFKSSYHMRQGNQLRLFCQAQRGFPAPQFSWYIGNRLIDAQFLRGHPNEIRIIQLNMNQNHTLDFGISSQQIEQKSSKIVEVNPIPAGRVPMSFTTNGRGHWVEYKEPRSERAAIESPEQQLRYMQAKLAQLNGINPPAGSSVVSAINSAATSVEQVTGSLGQAALSMLVVNAVSVEKHSSRFACRATTRANTDEVTTVIRVQASSTVSVKPSSGRATLIADQPLHFQCEMIGNKDAQFLWYRRPLAEGSNEELLEPNTDDTMEIHNERLTLTKPTASLAADYICRALSGEDKGVNFKEFAVIKVRSMPVILDFGLQTSHTGRSGIITEGDKLELTCTVRDKQSPVNITWLRSLTPDDDRTMLPLPEIEENSGSMNTLGALKQDPENWQFANAAISVVIEKVDSFTKKLIIESVKHEHRGHYACIADNGVTERARRIILIRVKDKLVALWPFLGIVAELIILFTIIYVWETQRAYKEINGPASTSNSGGAMATAGGSKRSAIGTSAAFENVPLTKEVSR